MPCLDEVEKAPGGKDRLASNIRAVSKKAGRPGKENIGSKLTRDPVDAFQHVAEDLS